MVVKDDALYQSNYSNYDYLAWPETVSVVLMKTLVLNYCTLYSILSQKMSYVIMNDTDGSLSTSNRILEYHVCLGGGTF